MMRQKEEENALTHESNDQISRDANKQIRQRGVQAQPYLERFTSQSRMQPLSMAQVPMNQNSFDTRNLQDPTVHGYDGKTVIEIRHEAADRRKKEFRNESEGWIQISNQHDATHKKPNKLRNLSESKN